MTVAGSHVVVTEKKEATFCVGRCRLQGLHILSFIAFNMLLYSQHCRKEALWPHVREFADRAISHVKSTLRSLSASGEACELYAVHGHYADAGEVATLMASSLGVDMVFTGHSLGRNKLDHLMRAGAVRPAGIGWWCHHFPSCLHFALTCETAC